MKKLLSILMCLLVLTGIGSVGISAYAYKLPEAEMGFPEKHITKLTSYNITDTESYNASIPHNILDIEAGAFDFCKDLSSITLHSDLRHIGEGAFSETAFYENSSNWQEGVLYIGTCLIKADPEKITSSTYVIRDGTTLIADGAFKGCTKLENFIMPESVKYVGMNAFAETGFYYNQNNHKNGALTLEHILLEVNDDISGRFRIPNDIRTIADGAFMNCTKLTQIFTPDSLEHIGGDAFANCRSLKRIDLQTELKTLGEGCFDSCYSLEEINLSPYNLYLTVLDKVLYTKDYSEVIRCPQGVTGTVTLPQSVKSIGADAFEGCASIDEITLPEGLLTINEGAFANSTISNINLPESLEYIGAFAFSRCHSLTGITIPDSVSYVGLQCFEYCSKLESAKLGYGITALPSSLFMYCEKLKTVTLGDNVRAISSSAFRSTPILSDKAGYTEGMLIIDSKYLIRVSETLETCQVPEGITCIADEAFADAIEKGTLKDITLPVSLVVADHRMFGYPLEGVKLRYLDTTEKLYEISDFDVYGMDIRTKSSDTLCAMLFLLLVCCAGFGMFVLYYTNFREEKAASEAKKDANTAEASDTDSEAHTTHEAETNQDTNGKDDDNDTQ